MVDAVAELERGRRAYSSGAWGEAHEALSQADRESPLGAADLELLATSAYMLGREDGYFAALERAHRGHLEDGGTLAAARCAIWLGIQLAVGGEMGRASGWLGRARRLVEREGDECVEQGYLLLPLAIEHELGGDPGAAAAVAAEAVGVAERFADRDLFALAIHEQGAVLIQDGQVKEGLELLDEAMVAATAEELSPIVTGIVYCGVILACQQVYELRRAREWTAALTRWCERQPDLVAFTGRCLVHRAEIMQIRGAWPDALEEARRAGSRSMAGKNPAAAGEAAYVRGEVHRLRGELAEAGRSYREASRLGREPQPGLALLRLAEGDRDAALAAIRRALGESTEPLRRVRLLPAQVEILLACGDLEEAAECSGELTESAAELGGGMPSAMAAHARGAVELARGDAERALPPLRRAFQLWQEIEVPYEAARARVLIGQACGVLGDGDAAALELEAARTTFTELGAEPDLADLTSLASTAAVGDPHALSDRELEVLRPLAAGATNRAIAAELVVSVRTVDRHVSNIFAKLGVSSRAAATAYAHKHRLV